jgi:hypothetical protein
VDQYLYLSFSKHKQCLLVQLNTAVLLAYPEKPSTLAGLKPGSSFPQADAMSTTPGRKGITPIFFQRKMTVFALQVRNSNSDTPTYILQFMYYIIVVNVLNYYGLCVKLF